MYQVRQRDAEDGDGKVWKVFKDGRIVLALYMGGRPAKYYFTDGMGFEITTFTLEQMLVMGDLLNAAKVLEVNSEKL